MQKGQASIAFDMNVYVTDTACIAGEKEGQGPLGGLIDQIVMDPYFGKNSWEEAESCLQSDTVKMLLEKAALKKTDIRYLFAGDLLGQLIATSFGLMDFELPLFGLYGACSTFGEAMSLGAMSVAGGFADKVVALASSHFASAEKQFRFPLEYGNQRPLSATWTITGCGAVILSKDKPQGWQERQDFCVRIAGITTGKIIDYGVKDSMNMGACMAPAACDVIYQNFMDFGYSDKDYDKIITGDLGHVGRVILIDLLKEKGFDISACYSDCGIEIFNATNQGTDSGGSGCGCSAVTFCSWIYDKIKRGEWKRVLFVPTGALLSTVSFNEGKSVPGIAHAVVLEGCDGIS